MSATNSNLPLLVFVDGPFLDENGLRYVVNHYADGSQNTQYLALPTGLYFLFED